MFTLTVHYYPEAAEAGVKPIEVCEYPEEHEPSHYRSHTFHFDKPPSRQDFLDMCYRFLPWTHVWEDNLLSLIKENVCGWPMLDCGQKAARQDVVDREGVKVGHLEVVRDYLVSAEGYDRNAIVIPHDDEEAVLNRIPKDRRTEADVALMDAENLVQERISLLEGQEVNIKAILREVLVQHGFLKAKGGKRAKAAV